MTAPIAQLSTAEVFDEIEAQLGSSAFYIDRDFTYASLARKAAQIQAVAPGEGLALRAHLDALLGDLPALARTIHTLKNAPHNEADIFNASMALGRVGLYSQAQELLAPLIRADSGKLSRRRDRAYATGLFQLTAAEFDRAKTMNLDLAFGEENPNGRAARDILAEGGISDATVAQYLDAAGDVLQGHKRLSHAIGLLASHGPEGAPVVVMQIAVPGDAATLFDLNVDLVDVMDQRGLPQLNNLLVTFAQLSEKAR